MSAKEIYIVCPFCGRKQKKKTGKQSYYCICKPNAIIKIIVKDNGK